MTVAFVFGMLGGQFGPGFTAHEPLIPLSVLNNDVVARGTVAASCGMGAYIGLSIYLPVYFQSARGMSITGPSASASGVAAPVVV